MLDDLSGSRYKPFTIICIYYVNVLSFKRVSFILHYIRRLLKIAKMLYFYQKACRYIVKFVYKLRPWISISYIDLSFIQNEFM
jgi:hypothetical protein